MNLQAVVSQGTVIPRVLKVAAKTEPTRLASALTPTLRESGIAIIELMGNDALTNALSAVVITRGHLASAEKDCIVVPSFVDLKVEGEAGKEDRKGLRLVVQIIDGPLGGHAAILEAMTESK